MGGYLTGGSLIWDHLTGDYTTGYRHLTLASLSSSRPRSVEAKLVPQKGVRTEIEFRAPPR